MLSSLASLLKGPVQEQPRNAKNDNVSVRSPDDIHSLENVIRGGPVTYVFVHADWCGHCQTYKPIWQQLLDIPGRKVKMGMIHHDMVERSAMLQSAKIPGYPTVLKVFPNGHIEKYKGEDNKQTNAVPKMRDFEVMRNEILTASRQLPTSSSTSKEEQSQEQEEEEEQSQEQEEEEQSQEQKQSQEQEEEEEELNSNLNENPKIPSNSNRKVFKLKNRAVATKKLKAPVSAQTIMPATTYSPASAVSRITNRNLKNASKNSLTISASPVPPMKGGSLFQALTHALTQTGPTALLLLANAALVKPTNLPPKKNNGSTMRLTRRSSRSRRSKANKSRKNWQCIFHSQSV